VALGSETGYPVLCGKDKKKREFAYAFFALVFLPDPTLLFASRSRARKREKSAGAQLCTLHETNMQKFTLR
jgi:hypothetical protein